VTSIDLFPTFEFTDEFWQAEESSVVWYSAWRNNRNFKQAAVDCALWVCRWGNKNHCQAIFVLSKSWCFSTAQAIFHIFN